MVKELVLGLYAEFPSTSRAGQLPMQRDGRGGPCLITHSGGLVLEGATARTCSVREGAVLNRTPSANCGRATPSCQSR